MKEKGRVVALTMNLSRDNKMKSSQKTSGKTSGKRTGGYNNESTVMKYKSIVTKIESKLKSTVTELKSIGYTTKSIGSVRKSAGFNNNRTKTGVKLQSEISPMALYQLEFTIRDSLTPKLTIGIK